MKRTLNIGSVISEPWVNPCFVTYPRNCPDPGIEAYLIHSVLSNLGFGVNFVKMESTEEMRQSLINGTIDVSAIAVIQNDVLDYPDFTQAVVLDQPIFFVQRKFGRTYKNALTNQILFSSYDGEVWALLALTFAFCLLLPKIFQRFLARKEACIPFLALNGWEKVIRTTGFFVLGLMMSVFGNLLAINLSKPMEQKQLFSNLLELSQLLESKQCTAVLAENHLDHPGQYREIVKPTSERVVGGEARKNMEKAWLSNPPIPARDNVHKAEIVGDSSVHCRIGLIPLTLKPWLEATFCQMQTIVLPEIPRSGFAYALSNEKVLAETIKVYLQQGDVDYFYNQIMNELLGTQKKAGNCSDDAEPEQVDRKLHALHLHQLVDVFFILVVVAGLAFSTFLLEILDSKTKFGLFILSEKYS